MHISPEYCNIDRHFSFEEDQPGFAGLDIVSAGKHLYGYTMLPGGKKGEKHPCVVMLHGFPGYTTNHDIAQALRRSGCVVINPFYRGAWGSEGFWTFSGMIEDVVAVVNQIKDCGDIAGYAVDVGQIFLCGISMGGFAAVNTMRRLPWIKGAVIMAPGDLRGCFINNNGKERFEQQMAQNVCLRYASKEAVWSDILQNCDIIGLEQAVPYLDHRDLYLLGGKRDTMTPVEQILFPFYEQLKSRNQAASLKLEIFDTDHAFSDCRMEISAKICWWIAAVCQRTEKF